MKHESYYLGYNIMLGEKHLAKAKLQRQAWLRKLISPINKIS
jgi:hypothetical protein